MSFDPTLPVRTRDGRSARIVCTDANYLDSSIIALISLPVEGFGLLNGKPLEVVMSYYDGGFRLPPFFHGKNRENPCDLVNFPPPRSHFFNVYDSGVSGSVGWSSLKKAEQMRQAGCIHTLELIFEGTTLIETKVHPLT